MFHEVRIFDPKGNLKRVVSSKKLSKRHWQIYKSSEKQISAQNFSHHAVPKWVKEKLDIEFISPDYGRTH
ncbi:hypothetical protein UR09_01190 [Candidatus Nitromaritima sp. SCGC AAA799-A02]|nr:hypothetical protein UZ36_04125 [Candidatus Nitromaritima sp. SCGC AAA799-C22]KMP12379.1 hypothetical protein UR09_01190 [Candidatus Nitromaritima sp. SCGC AAA799-A02]